jgi:hypothetical protein
MAQLVPTSTHRAKAMCRVAVALMRVSTVRQHQLTRHLTNVRRLPALGRRTAAGETCGAQAVFIGHRLLAEESDGQRAMPAFHRRSHGDDFGRNRRHREASKGLNDETINGASTGRNHRRNQGMLSPVVSQRSANRRRRHSRAAASDNRRKKSIAAKTPIVHPAHTLLGHPSKPASSSEPLRAYVSAATAALACLAIALASVARAGLRRSLTDQR